MIQPNAPATPGRTAPSVRMATAGRMAPTGRVATVVVAAVALLAGGCGGTAWDEQANPARTDAPLSAPAPSASASASTSAPAPAGTSVANVPESLRFTATTLNGEPFQGTSLAGRPVVFWFWAPWCPKCRSEAPAVKAAAAANRDVTFVGVAGLDTEAAMKEFVQRTGTGDIVQLSDRKGAVWTKLGVSEQSTFVFMKPDGSPQKVSGPLDQDKLNGHLKRLTG
ncbi:redoxin domain-containing protein [Nonomuraea sp. NN258]|uniref:redoxin domain-containing protein n=1 Tax=Nonomuraea antri TaxID=2730852 RepID=UPI00156A623E|nr:redoxin domain-containing protein [Nonomuraea antri]NRQ35804.1 redoxin domain-containing protein [Nonomuraea antri]